MKYTFTLLVAISVIGCKESPTSSDTPQSGVIQPLAVGNYWHYKWTYYHYDFVLDSQEVTERIARDTLVGAETWYAMTYDDVFDPGHYFANRSDGLYVMDPSSIAPEIYQQVPYPATVGKRLVHRYAGGFYFDSLYLKAVNVPITTPAGHFRCLKFSEVFAMNGDTSYHEVYYAPNVGRVRTDMYVAGDPTSYIREVRELQDYKIN